MRIVTVSAALLLLAGLPAAAQNNAGVFGPVVNEGYRAMQFRLAHDFDSHGLAQRLQYQQALNGDLMLRGIVQALKTDDKNFDVDFFQAELFWQLDDLADGWRHGLRFDVRVRTEGRNGAVGVNWASQFDLGERWMARFIVLTATDVGSGASGDVALQTRASVTRTTGRGLRAGLEMFNLYGVFGDVPTLDRQLHQAGPALSAPVGGRWQVYSSILFGLTGATPDTQARLWLIGTF